MNVAEHIRSAPRMGVRRPPEAETGSATNATGFLNLNLVHYGRKIREVSKMWIRTLPVVLAMRTA